MDEAAGSAKATPWVVSYERLRQGDYFADFRRDTRIFPEMYHCIIQRDGSADILSWTQHSSLEEAIQSAEATLAEYVRGSGEAQKAVGES